MAFDPVSLAVIGTVVGLAGTAATVTSTLASNNYQRQVARRNAAVAEQNAQRSVQASQSAQEQQDQETRALLGQQLAVQSASGLKLGGRSQMLTRKSARMLGRMDALAIREAGDVEAWNFRMMANEEYSKMKFLQQSSNFAILGGFLDAASVGISGGAKISDAFGARKPSATKAGSALASFVPGGYNFSTRQVR
jgi:hypothetical protein